MFLRAIHPSSWQVRPAALTLSLMKRSFTLTALFGTLIFLSMGSAKAETVIGVFNDWSAFTETEGGRKTCYIGSVPKKSAGNYTQRDPTYVIVTHRPAEGTRDEVSIRAGYPYRDGSNVTVKIDNGSYTLWTQGGHAWANNNDDPKLVTSMRRGNAMVVKGTSSRGTLTTDSYSLTGFTAAYNAASRACGL